MLYAALSDDELLTLVYNIPENSTALEVELAARLEHALDELATPSRTAIIEGDEDVDDA